jgi:hypothetical protein
LSIDTSDAIEGDAKNHLMDLHTILRRYWGHGEFRQGQEANPSPEIKFKSIPLMLLFCEQSQHPLEGIEH